jgi:methylenetetrahydrofolate dehydrogenase (NADP+)/methenyltetrahydrofolate cyclohydrolase
VSTLLSGLDVVEALSERIAEDVAELKLRKVTPLLAIIRVGERSDDISYERAATKCAAATGIAVRNLRFSAHVRQDELVRTIEELNVDATVHGVLLFRPLPEHIDENLVRNTLNPAKDIDGITDLSLAGVFTNTDIGYAPCTPVACMEILDHFGIEVKGRRALIIGRSLVVGKPLAMMLLGRDATVTIAHSRSAQLPKLVCEAELVISCVGRAKLIGADHLSAGQVVIDVGINTDADGSLVGDVDAGAASVVEALTPVPGGVGTVTTTVLIKHVVEAARKSSGGHSAAQ